MSAYHKQKTMAAEAAIVFVEANIENGDLMPDDERKKDMRPRPMRETHTGAFLAAGGGQCLTELS